MMIPLSGMSDHINGKKHKNVVLNLEEVKGIKVNNIVVAGNLVADGL